MCNPGKGDEFNKLAVEKRRIKSNLFVIIFFVLLISILIQHFIFEADLKQYFVELICVVFSGYYLIVANIRAGNYVFEKENSKKIFILNISLTSFIATLIFSVGNYFIYQEKYKSILDLDFLLSVFIFMITMIAVAFSLFSMFRYIKMKVEKDMQRV